MHKAAGTILTFKGLTLIGRRSQFTETFQGYWSMPCGMIDQNENAKDAAIREVHEETLINLNPQNVNFLTSYKINDADEFAVFHSELEDLIFPDENAKDFFEHDEWGYYNIQENSLPTPMTENIINSILMLK